MLCLTAGSRADNDDDADGDDNALASECQEACILLVRLAALSALSLGVPVVGYNLLTSSSYSNPQLPLFNVGQNQCGIWSLNQLECHRKDNACSVTLRRPLCQIEEHTFGDGV